MDIRNNIPSGSYSDFGSPVRVFDVALTAVQIVSLVIFVLTGLSILITKIKAKNQSEPKKVKKWVKILSIVSIIIFILITIAKPIIYNIEVIIKNA